MAALCAIESQMVPLGDNAYRCRSSKVDDRWMPALSRRPMIAITDITVGAWDAVTVTAAAVKRCSCGQNG